jgi:hypothetical protein
MASKDQIHHLLTGRFPHKVHFANHQSLFDKWEFTSDQVVKLIESGAAGIWGWNKEPITIHPMGVVDSAGKDRLIFSGMYLVTFPREAMELIKLLSKGVSSYP